MIISYCLNPKCLQPKNHPKSKQCNSCGSNLILHNHYRAIKVLGKGGFGATFIGVDFTKEENVLCVIKQLRPNADDPKSIETAINLFQREAKILAQINHPQIPKLIDYFEDSGQFYLIQELINGKNLQKEIKKNGVYGELAIRQFLEEITPIIKYIHSQKIIHRDIKPGNILRRKKDHKLVLIDFGAVKDQVNTQLDKTLGQTAFTQFSVGTQGYAPPEQLAMRPIYSSDIYALGATCVYLLTGKSPRKFDVDVETGCMLWQHEVNVSNFFKHILEKMLAINTRERFKTIDELMAALNIEPLANNLTQNVLIQSRENSGNLVKSLPISQVNLNDFSATQISQSSSLNRNVKQVVQNRQRQSKQNKLIKWDELKFVNACNNGRKDFSEQNLKKLNLEGGRLNQYIFRYAQLQQVIFIGANLAQANFYSANLAGANFKRANLQETYFSKSNLQNVSFQDANLTRADFTNANLKGVNFCGANLTNAKINQEQLKQVKVNWNTIFPDGSKRWWKIF